MALKVPNQGEVIALELFVGKGTLLNLVLRLYKSNTTPADTDTEANYTEATFTGYGAQTMTPANWVSTGGNPSNVTYNSQITFTSSANQTPSEAVYGYYFTQVTSGKLVWSERFSDGPYPITNLNDAIKITPTITLQST